MRQAPPARRRRPAGPLRADGETRIHPLLLAYHRCAWAVQDIAAHGEEVLTTPTLGQQSRRAAKVTAGRG